MCPIMASQSDDSLPLLHTRLMSSRCKPAWHSRLLRSHCRTEYVSLVDCLATSAKSYTSDNPCSCHPFLIRSRQDWSFARQRSSACCCEVLHAFLMSPNVLDKCCSRAAQVQVEESREEISASFQDQMRDLQAQLSRVGDQLATTQQQAEQLQEANSQNQEELRVARISSDHLSNDLARALEQANTWREECVTLQVRAHDIGASSPAVWVAIQGPCGRPVATSDHGSQPQPATGQNLPELRLIFWSHCTFGKCTYQWMAQVMLVSVRNLWS